MKKVLFVFIIGCSLLSVGSITLDASIGGFFKKVGEGVKKGAEETGKAIKTGAQETGKAIKKGAEAVGKAAGDVAKNVGNVVVKIGKKSGELAVEVGKSTKQIILETGAVFKKDDNYIGNVKGAVVNFTQAAYDQFPVCAKAALKGGQFLVASTLQKTIDLAGGAFENVFMINAMSIKGSTDELIKEGVTPKVGIEGTLVGKKVTFSLQLDLKHPEKSAKKIIDYVVDRIS